MNCLNELTKNDHKMLKGLAVLGMVCLHLFCRLGDLPYTPFLWIGNGPLIYYIGLFGDICVPIFAFLSGYAHYLQYSNDSKNYCKNIKKLSAFIINIWIVIILISILGLIFDSSKQIPGSLFVFIGNLLLIQTYAGSWWYIVVYLLLVLFSYPVFSFVKKNNAFITSVVFSAIYCATYFLRFNDVIHINSFVMNWLYVRLILFGNTLFSYVIGMLYRKHKIIIFLRNKCSGAHWTVLLLFLVLCAVVFHGVFQSVSIAPLNAFLTLTVLAVIEKTKWVESLLTLVGRHSTNIWLLHMFFYQYIFRDFVFRAKYPLLILIFTICLCMLLSILINYILSRVMELFFGGPSNA